MTDIAELDIRADSRDLVRAKDALDGLTASAVKTEQATAGISRGLDNAAQGANRARIALGQFVAAGDQSARAFNNNATAAAGFQRSVGSAAATVEQSIAAHVRAEAAAGRWSKAANEVANTSRLAAHQVQNLRAQFIDVGVSLQGGMNPFTVLVQQGPQIAQVFGPGTGVAGILRGVVTEAQRLVPLSLGIAGGVAGGVGVLAKAYLEFDANTKAVSVGITGLGRQSGIAAGEIEQIARASTLATDSATRYATAFASTGNATRETLATALNSTRDFATTFGTNFDEAAKIQQEFFTDGSAAYDKYAARLGTYNATTSRLLQDMQKQGRSSDVVRMALDEINPRLAKYNELASYGQRATNFLGDAWGNFWSNVNRGSAVVMNDPRLNVTPQQTAAAVLEGQLAKARSDQERASNVVIQQSRTNQLLSVNPVEREVKQNIERAGLGDGDKYKSVEERFAGVFGTASKPDLGSYRAEARERPNTLYPTGETLAQVAERAERSMIAKPEESKAQVRRVTEQANDISQARALNDVSEQSTRTQQAQAQALGKTAGEAERLTTRAGLLNRATADGIPLSEANRRRIDEVSAAIGRQQQAYVEAAASREVLFQRSQLTRTPQEQGVAAGVRQIYGDQVDQPGARALGEQLRLNASIRDTQMAWSSLAQMGSGLIDPLLDSTRSWSSAFVDLSRNIGRAALQAALFGQGPLAALFGAQGAGAGPGGVFGQLLGPIGASAKSGGGILGFLGLGGGASASSAFGASDYFKAASVAVPGAYGPGFATGGVIRGPGTGTSDSIVARLSDGEFIVNASATRRHRSLLEQINGTGLPGFSAGGLADRWALGLPGFATGGGVGAADRILSPTPEVGEELVCEVEVRIAA
ncbi:phage tail length tape measure family protein (plasmid) [Methylobacterium currus]|uniref:phage tail length tape measure family protein n=1 Tax=Methylobacterium currus TaxID=2051553 RepID=UPI001E4AB288|nr:phage tail length tape measure family protein [Methylobacterium currus]UHC20472.1 phage tail length tape measure family protein [Methylobacterium currus]